MYSPVCGMVLIKYPKMLFRKGNHVLAASGFLFCYLNDPLPYLRHIITIVLSVSLN